MSIETKTITVARQTTVEEEVTVEFPLHLYGSDDIDDGRVTWGTHIRITADGRMLSVTETHAVREVTKFRIETYQLDLERQLDQYLNTYTYRRITPDSFAAALAEAQREIISIAG